MKSFFFALSLLACASDALAQCKQNLNRGIPIHQYASDNSYDIVLTFQLSQAGGGAVSGTVVNPTDKGTGRVSGTTGDQSANLTVNWTSGPNAGQCGTYTWSLDGNGRAVGQTVACQGGASALLRSDLSLCQ